MSTPLPSLNEAVAAEIRGEMARQRKTGTGLAEVLHCSQQSASRRLSGAQRLDLDELAVIADWLGVTLLDLIAPGAEKAA